jgi:dGTPase
MDWADDIAYSVHDLEDFHRGRLIPWRQILSKEGRDQLVAEAMKHRDPRLHRRRLNAAHGRLARLVEGTVQDLLDQPYEGTREQRRAIRLLTSTLIGRYISSVRLVQPAGADDSTVSFDIDALAEVHLLKQIAVRFIIQTPALQAQQRGQAKILTNLFGILFSEGSESFLPKRFTGWLSGPSRGRGVADCIASLTEAEAIHLHDRLFGVTSGSVLDPIVF